jgi:hypothetical protein
VGHPLAWEVGNLLGGQGTVTVIGPGSSWSNASGVLGSPADLFKTAR